MEELGLTREDVGRRVGRSRVAVSNLIRLLDLPDEAVELIQLGSLSEGHGRALLLAEDHAARRSLARDAAAAGWSVRVTEERARACNAREAPARRRIAPPPIHPDQEHAAREIAEGLGAALGAEVRVRPRGDGGYTAELSFSSVEDAAELTRRLDRSALIEPA